jgi:hypothetical protein
MRLLLTGLVVLLVVVSSHGASIQASLIRASNTSEASDEALKEWEPKLKKEFGYKFYHLLGAKQESLDQKTKSRLDLGEGFVLFVTPRSVDKTANELELEWWSGRALLVKTLAKIPAKRSVFIKGPGVGEDWIILALSVHE